MTMTDIAPPAAEAGSAGTGKGKGKKADKGRNTGSRSGRSNLLPAIVLAGGIAAGGYFMGGGATDAATTQTTAPAVAEGPLVAIDAMTVNLSGGRYLRVGVSFQMTDAYEDAIEGAAGESFPQHDASRVQDLLIASLAGRSPSELETPAGRDEVKQELLEQVDLLFDDGVLEIYFTEFVIQ